MLSYAGVVLVVLTSGQVFSHASDCISYSPGESSERNSIDISGLCSYSKSSTSDAESHFVKNRICLSLQAVVLWFNFPNSAGIATFRMFGQS